MDQVKSLLYVSCDLPLKTLHSAQKVYLSGSYISHNRQRFYA